MMKLAKPLALAAVTLTSGCAGLHFEPTANWLRDGGRLCAASRDPAGDEWRTAARTCVQAEAHVVPVGR